MIANFFDFFHFSMYSSNYSFKLARIFISSLRIGLFDISALKKIAHFTNDLIISETNISKKLEVKYAILH